jgi:hypothetical protein
VLGHAEGALEEQIMLGHGEAAYQNTERRC